jgi:pyruvate formate lyase activating enzyme
VTEADGRTLLPRIPLIPDITDTDENITDIARFLRHIGVERAALMAYNPLWHEKSDKIGADDPWRDNKMMSSWPTRERLARCKEILAREGIHY